MAEQSATTTRGLFNRDMLGKSDNPVTVPIERGRIRFFAEVLEERDPIHFDVAAARASGHPDLVATPSFYMVIEALANEERRRAGVPSMIEMVGCDFRYLLHGNESYAYHGPIYASDEVTITATAVDFFDKKDGQMEFVKIESTVTHAQRGRLITAERILLHRLK